MRKQSNPEKRDLQNAGPITAERAPIPKGRSRERPSRNWGLFLLLGIAAIVLGGAGYLLGTGVVQIRASLRCLPEHPPVANDAVTEPEPFPLPAEQKTGRVPAEFEHQAAIMLGCNELLEYHPSTLAQIIGAIHDRIKIIGLVDDAAQRAKVVALLHEHNLPASAVDFFVWPTESMWVQDFGPICVVNDQHVTVVDFAYPAANRDLSNLVPFVFASTFKLGFDHCHLSFEGGNMLSNGQGWCITSSRLIDENVEREDDPQKIGGLLHEHLHFDRWSYLRPLEGEPDFAHIDMFVTLCKPTTAIVGEYDSDEDPVNGKILDNDAAILEKGTPDQAPMKVIRIPMPTHHDGSWRTYTNVIFANGTLLVPQYPDTAPDLDKIALETYHKVLPDWKIVGIDCTRLIGKRGALHCISRCIPSLGK